VLWEEKENEKTYNNTCTFPIY